MTMTDGTRGGDGARMHAAAPARRGPFDVWAPRAARVDLVLDPAGAARTVPMRAGDGGWFAPVEPVGDVAEGTDYAYRLDGGEALLPSPTSRHQPHGVHGPSRTFDPHGFAWTDAAWPGRQLAGAVVYELHIGAFTPQGTLDAAIERLDHLVELGADVVELMPVGAFNGDRGWGYDGVDWFAVHEAYGGPRAYQRFVDAAHARGLAVVQDVVYNHFGPSGNYLGAFGPYLQDGTATGWGESLNLDGPGSDEVRRYVLDNAAMWFDEFHVDGLRLDAVHALRDTRAVHVLEELARETEARSAASGRPLSLIAESDLNDPRMITPVAQHGLGMHGQWSDDFHHAAHTALTGERQGYYEDFADHGLAALAKVLERGFFHDGSFSSFRDRHHGRPLGDETPAWRLVTCIQNHDQVGNRAAGDRLGATLSDDRLVVGAALLLTAPFTPMLFMGEEWGAATPFAFFASHPEPELARAVSEGRVREFARMGWDESTIPDPQAPSTFEASRLDWAEARSPRGERLFDAYRTLIRLRRELPALTDPRLGSRRVEADEAARTLVLRAGDVRVAFVLGDEPREIALDVADDAVIVWRSHDEVALGEVTLGDVVRSDDTGAQDARGIPARILRLPAWSAAIVTV